MKQILFLFLSLIALISCSKSDTDPKTNTIEDKPTILKVKHEQGAGDILSVRLVGYDFDNLAIKPGKSQEFTLDKGMPSGYSDINIAVRHRNYSGRVDTYNKSIDIKKGEVNTVTLRNRMLN